VTTPLVEAIINTNNIAVFDMFSHSS